jgi:esterase/lipase superfamily enzyme
VPTESPYSRYREILKRRIERPIDSRARRVTIASKTLGVNKSFYVSLPPGYHRITNAQTHYPTLYLFRGHEREWVHRFQDKSRHGRTVIDVYRELLEEGKIGPMILVFPGISSNDNRIPGLLVNFREPELAKGVPGIGTGRFEDYFVEELIPYVDGRFRTIASREGRAVDGFSLGGFQSIKVAAQHPDLFTSAGSFDGTFLYSTYRGRSIKLSDHVLNNPMFTPAFGTDRDVDFMVANSPANLLWRTDRRALADVQWLIHSGPASAEPWQSNYYRAQHVVGILKSRRLHNGTNPVLRRARHSWYWADKHMKATLPLHWRAMDGR